MTVNYSSDLLRNVHQNVLLPEIGQSFLVKGDYEYWHYCCDGFNDKGWGCGYRTLQTICSWIIENGNLGQSVPSIRRIQEVLVTLNDKEQPFIGSREWIGSFEFSTVLAVAPLRVHIEKLPGLGHQLFPMPVPHRLVLQLDEQRDRVLEALHVRLQRVTDAQLLHEFRQSAEYPDEVVHTVDQLLGVQVHP